MMRKPIEGFKRVKASDAEIANFKRSNGGAEPRSPRLECLHCGKRIWGGGLGIRRHREHCEGGHA